MKLIIFILFLPILGSSQKMYDGFIMSKNDTIMKCTVIASNAKDANNMLMELSKDYINATVRYKLRKKAPKGTSNNQIKF
jgi:hypothetical protein